MDFGPIRKKFPILEKGTFLNHASTVPLSYTTIEAMKVFCDEMQEPLRKNYSSWIKTSEETRHLLAELLNCPPAQLAFTANTSTSLSIIAGCLDFKVGERVLIPRNEFPSNRYIWKNLQDQGVECIFFDIPNDSSLIENLEQQDLTNVRLISVSLVSYLTGKKQDIQAFGTFCRKHNIISCVDAIQGVGTFPINLEETNVDFFAGGAQKWLLGPIGCGYLYIRKELIEKVRVPLVGWKSVQHPENFEENELMFAEDATRFEVSHLNAVSIGGFNASLKELKNIGWGTIYERISSNTRYLVERADSLITNLNDLGAIVTFKIPHKIDPKKLQDAFMKKEITITVRSHYIRVSPHFYNTQEELDYFLQILNQVNRI